MSQNVFWHLFVTVDTKGLVSAVDDDLQCISNLSYVRVVHSKEMKINLFIYSI